MVIENLCPVCGYEMEDPPKDYNICPSCGTEFGNHDLNASISELRAAWIGSGPKWWSKTDPQPENWNPFAQLAIVSASGSSIVSEQEVVFVISSTATVTTSLPMKISLPDWAAGLAWAQPEGRQREVTPS